MDVWPELLPRARKKTLLHDCIPESSIGVHSDEIGFSLSMCISIISCNFVYKYIVTLCWFIYVFQ